MIKETHRFQTEDKRLLDLVVHSLYSNKDIFLRELISNSVDAITKVRFEGLNHPEILANRSEDEIVIHLDPHNKTLTISDTGIGMNREELIKNLGTIAKSGTNEFFEKMNQEQNVDLIGRFGVGFYSVFMVADHVDVISRSVFSQESCMFSSQGQGEYTIEESSRSGAGTTIIAHLKDDTYLDEYKVRTIVQEYSQFASVPIYLEYSKTTEGNESQEIIKDKINVQEALWLMPKQNVSDEQHKNFYQQISHDYQDPLTHVHGKIEGNNTYHYLLYIPKKLPFSLWHQEKPKSVTLYVKKTKITDDSELLVPRYLGFLSGVVDFQDLPLNVSRELLQDHKVVERAKGVITKKVLAHLQYFSQEKPEEYLQFIKEFGTMLKMFPAEDLSNKDAIVPLLRFCTTQNPQGEPVALEDYISRMKEDQKSIYYICASNLDAALNSPHMDYFKSKNIEVLLLTDRIDESLMNYIGTYKEKEFQSITRASLNELTELQEAQKKELTQDKQDLCTKIAQALSGKVKEVRISARLTESPACLVVDQALTLHLQRLLKEAGQSLPEMMPILEINATHPLLQQMIQAPESDITRWSNFLYSLALLAEGGQLSDPATFSKQIGALLKDVHIYAEI